MTPAQQHRKETAERRAKLWARLKREVPGFTRGKVFKASADFALRALEFANSDLEGHNICVTENITPIDCRVTVRPATKLRRARVTVDLGALQAVFVIADSFNPISEKLRGKVLYRTIPADAVLGACELKWAAKVPTGCE